MTGNWYSRLFAAGWALACAVPFQSAFPQTFPSKEIEVVAHTGPSGGAAIFGRYVIDVMNREKILPQTMIVVNKPGGGGAVALSYIAGKRGEPHTMLIVATTTLLTAPVRTGLDLGLDKFTPLALFGFDVNVIAVRADSAYKTLQDLVAAGKREPKAINVGVGSIGGTGHMLTYLIEKATGAKYNVISHKSGGEAVVGTLGGYVQFTTENLSEMMPHVDAKKIRVLAVPTEKRVPQLPGVPTLKELGFNIHAGVGRGFAAPAGIPKDARAVLEAALERAYKTKAWKDYSTQNMFEDVYMDGARFAKYLASRQPEMTQFARDTGLEKKKR